MSKHLKFSFIYHLVKGGHYDLISLHRPNSLRAALGADNAQFLSASQDHTSKNLTAFAKNRGAARNAAGNNSGNGAGAGHTLGRTGSHKKLFHTLSKFETDVHKAYEADRAKLLTEQLKIPVEPLLLKDDDNESNNKEDFNGAFRTSSKGRRSCADSAIKNKRDSMTDILRRASTLNEKPFSNFYAAITEFAEDEFNGDFTSMTEEAKRRRRERREKGDNNTNNDDNNNLKDAEGNTIKKRIINENGEVIEIESDSASEFGMAYNFAGLNDPTAWRNNKFGDKPVFVKTATTVANLVGTTSSGGVKSNNKMSAIAKEELERAIAAAAKRNMLKHHLAGMNISGNLKNSSRSPLHKMSLSPSSVQNLTPVTSCQTNWG